MQIQIIILAVVTLSLIKLALHESSRNTVRINQLEKDMAGTKEQLDQVIKAFGDFAIATATQLKALQDKQNDPSETDVQPEIDAINAALKTAQDILKPAASDAGVSLPPVPETGAATEVAPSSEPGSGPDASQA